MFDNPLVINGLIASAGGAFGVFCTLILGLNKARRDSEAIARTAVLEDQQRFRTDLMTRIGEVQGQLAACMSACAECQHQHAESLARERRLMQRVSALEVELHRRREADHGTDVGNIEIPDNASGK